MGLEKILRVRKKFKMHSKTSPELEKNSRGRKKGPSKEGLRLLRHPYGTPLLLSLKTLSITSSFILKTTIIKHAAKKIT